jgi:hypothetical protein
MLLAFMIVAQGLLGYGLVSVIGVIPADILQGVHYGRQNRRRVNWLPGKCGQPKKVLCRPQVTFPESLQVNCRAKPPRNAPGSVRWAGS